MSVKSVEPVLHGVVKMVWSDDQAGEIDFGAGAARRPSERQAELRRYAS